MTISNKHRAPTMVEGDVEYYGGTLDDINDFLSIPVELGLGQNKEERVWKTIKSDFLQFMAAVTTHKVAKHKDGKCFTQGSIIGKRRIAVAMEKMDLLVLDMDTGQEYETIRERILEEGLFAIIYTTHSNGATTSDVSKSVFYKKLGLDDEDEITDKLCGHYFETFKRYTSDIAKTITFNRVEHTPEGIKIFVDHAPMQKYRIVFLLEEPFVFAEESANQTKAIEKWKKKYAGVADMLGAFYDHSCVDPSRLFYYPTHKSGGEYHVEVIIGDTLDLDTIKDGDPKAMKTGTGNAYLDDAGEGDSEYVFQNNWVLDWFKRYGDRFAAGDFVRDTFSHDIRMDTGEKVTTRCPFDDNHSDAGKADDKGFFASNAGEWSIGEDVGKIGLMKCSHGGCKEYKSPHFIDQMVSNGDIRSADDLKPYLQELVGDEPEDDVEEDSDSESESPADKTKPKDEAKTEDLPPWEDENVKISTKMAAILRDIQKLDVVSDIGNILTDIVKGEFNDSEKSLLIGAIVKATKRARAEIKKRLDGLIAAKNREEEEKVDEGNGITRVYVTDNFDIQVKAVLTAFDKIRDFYDPNSPNKKQRNHKVMPLFKTTDGHLARVSSVQGTGTSKLELMDKSQLFVALTDIVKFYAEIGGGKSRQVAAPPDIVQYFTGIDIDRIPLPILSRVVKHPIFDSKGELVSAPGYDQLTASYIDLAEPIPAVSGKPTKDELDEAYDLLFENVFVDFPFQDGDDLDGQASKANLLAMLIQPFVRDIIGTAATPLYVINKPVAGAGSGKLVDCINIIQTGEAVQTSQFTANDEENAKVITSRLKSDPAATMFFDNVNVKVQSGSLASAITSGMYSARLLGGNDEIKVQMQGIWAMSGIAMTFSTELARRVAPITLIPAEAKPEDRQNFVHNDLLFWVEDNRPDLLWAVCTIIQAWVEEGMPNWSKPPIGSFERWSRTIGGIVESFDMQGFMDNAGDFRRDTSFESDADLEFVTYIFNENAFTLDKVWTCADLFKDMWDETQNAFENLSLPKVTTRSVSGARNSFGMYVKGLLGRKFEVFDKEGEKRVVFIQRLARKTNNVNAFFLAEVKSKT